MMSEFEKQVRHALIDRDMTMTDLANELGITISYVSDLLKGKRTNQEQLQRIKEFLAEAGGYGASVVLLPGPYGCGGLSQENQRDLTRAARNNPGRFS